MFPIPVIHTEARKRGLAYLLIGGHAVNAYCEPRATLDVDLLVRKADADRWRTLLDGEGFRLLRDAENFLQFSPPYGIRFRLDLMLVNDATFGKLEAAARQVSCLGVQTLVPSAQHLIALKVHALRHGPPQRRNRDWLDVENLVRATQLSPRGDELRELFRRQGTPELYAEFLKRCAHDEQA